MIFQGQVAQDPRNVRGKLRVLVLLGMTLIRQNALHGICYIDSAKFLGLVVLGRRAAVVGYPCCNMTREAV